VDGDVINNPFVQTIHGIYRLPKGASRLHAGLFSVTRQNPCRSALRILFAAELDLLFLDLGVPYSVSTPRVSPQLDSLPPSLLTRMVFLHRRR